MIGLSRQFRDKKYITMGVSSSTSTNLDPSVTSAPEPVRWQFIGSSSTPNYVTDADSFNKAVSGSFNLILWARDFKNIDAFTIGGDPISGSVDASLLTQLSGGTFDLSTTQITSLILPSSSNFSPTNLYLDNTSISGTLDLSNVTGMRGGVWLHTCPDISDVLYPTCSNSITDLSLQSMTSVITQDISQLTNLNTSIKGYFSTVLKTINNPSSSGTFTTYHFQNCALDYVDMKPLISASHVNSANFKFQNNAMTATEVNHMLVDFDSGSIDGSYTGRVIDISGTNTTPDGTSGGFDGLQATSSLLLKNFTVTTT